LRAGHLEDLRRARVRPPGRAGRGAARHGQLVPGQPGLVGAAQGAGRPRVVLMRWLVTGAAGMLGRDLCAALDAAGEPDVVAATRELLDITDAAAVTDAVAGIDVVVNAAAWTDVDGAETQEAAATLVNGAAALAAGCAGAGARLLQVSTDYVFP